MLKLGNLGIDTGDFAANLSDAVWIDTRQFMQLGSKRSGFFYIDVLVDEVPSLILNGLNGTGNTCRSDDQGDAANGEAGNEGPTNNGSADGHGAFILPPRDVVAQATCWDHDRPYFAPDTKRGSFMAKKVSVGASEDDTGPKVSETIGSDSPTREGRLNLTMHHMTTSFVRRLRDRDEAAWFELWQVFGPVLRGQLMKWGNGRLGMETVRDLSQETLAALSKSIERFDPTRGVRFSTWLLAIARHALSDEMDRRMALKRGAGKRPIHLQEDWMGGLGGAVDAAYEQRIFEAKVAAAIRRAESASDFVSFEVYRMRVLDGRSGKDVAVQLGVSQPTISRHLQQARGELRNRLTEIVATWSFTAEEMAEAELAGLSGDDTLFDEALSEIWHRAASSTDGEC
jgi:RNA polymerase sigma factor (sigma-70 family)